MTVYFLYQYFKAFISTGCKLPSQRKRNSHMTYLGRRRFLAYVKSSCGVNKCAQRIEGVTPRDFAYIRNRAFRVLTNVPVDSLFVVNTLENFQGVQSVSNHRLQC